MMTSDPTHWVDWCHWLSFPRNLQRDIWMRTSRAQTSRWDQCISRRSSIHSNMPPKETGRWFSRHPPRWTRNEMKSIGALLKRIGARFLPSSKESVAWIVWRRSRWHVPTSAVFNSQWSTSWRASPSCTSLPGKPSGSSRVKKRKPGCAIMRLYRAFAHGFHVKNPSVFYAPCFVLAELD